MRKIFEPIKEIPVIENVDICVLGGSCTGAFAAVRAARLGASVVIVEKQNSFGGVATNGLVNIWHSFFDTEHKNQIMAGLNLEVIERLKKRDAVLDREKELGENDPNAYRLNTEELKIDLDELIKESGVKPYFHTMLVSPFVKEGELKAIIIENKSGRQAIEAKVFIDATGDGDLCYHLGLNSYTMKHMQPPTTCAKIYGMNSLGDFNLTQAIRKYRKEFNLQEDWGWRTAVPFVKEVEMHANTHIFKRNCADANDLTFCEIEGRRHVRAIMDIVRKYGPENSFVSLMALPSYIGIRDTRHFVSGYKMTEHDVLAGTRFDDAIANGSYRVDIHHSDIAGITFRYLDGTEEVIEDIGAERKIGRWRPETPTNPTFYQIPYRALVPGKFKNLLMAGRMLDAEEAAYGGLRVMVNMNQIGEAAGVAAYMALDTGKSVEEIDTSGLRQLLKAGGSLII